MIPAKGIRPLQWFFSFLFVFVSISVAVASGPDVIKASRHDGSHPLSQMAIRASSNDRGSNGQTTMARSTGSRALA
jgi:hypothetical protein